jgi:hypothetical protein
MLSQRQQRIALLLLLLILAPACARHGAAPNGTAAPTAVPGVSAEAVDVALQFVEAAVAGDRERLLAVARAEPWCSPADYPEMRLALLDQWGGGEFASPRLAAVDVAGTPAFPPEVEGVQMTFQWRSAADSPWREQQLVLLTVPLPATAETWTVCDFSLLEPSGP